MSATTTEAVSRSPGRLAAAVSDGWVLTKRNLLTYVRKPDLLVFSTIQPVMFVLLFVYVFGGAIEAILPPDVPYVDFLMPGIFVQTAIFSALQTGVGLAEDLQKGLIDRFKSLPMARSAVLAGRTAADGVAIVFQIVLMFIVAWLVGFRFHEGVLEFLLAFVGAISIGYAFTWVAAFAGLSLKSVEAVQAATFTIVFPVVFASAAFVPIASFPSWLQGWASINPVTIWVDTFRVLSLGELYTENVKYFPDVSSLGTLLWQSVAWVVAILALAVPLAIRVYRRT
ncbi:MAG TPA: ABC transporter permease [Actinomycetota bacterium]|nr:ABC transporter permease [Actinomycetota bacterium]